MKTASLFTVAVCLLWLIVPAHGAEKLPFESARPLYVGARALGRGNAFTAVADDATAGFWNPAGLIQWQGVRLFGVNKFHDRRDYRFDPKGIGYSYRGYGLFWGNKIALGVDSGVPDFNYYGVACQLGSYTAVGASLKFKRRHPSDVYQFFGYETAYDIGVLVKPRADFKLGCLLQNLEGYGLHWITLGAAYRYADDTLSESGVFHPAHFELSMDVALSTEGETPELYLGAVWHPFPYLPIRLGSSNGDVTAGIGIAWKGIRIDYARIFEKRFVSDFVSAELRF